jgi:hypothetical protein
MLRRLFFVVPEEQDAENLVAESEAAGVAPDHIHSLARPGRRLGSLLPVTARQRRDTVWRIEQTYWIVLLVVFAIALAALVGAWHAGSAWGATTAVIIMALSVAGGIVFVWRLPDVHLDEFRGALAHGEILVMLDVPARRVAEIEQLVERRHPEAVVGGVGWTPGRFGV